MATQLRVALWRVPTIVTTSDVAALSQNTIAGFTHEERVQMLRDGVNAAIAHFGVAPANTTVVNMFVVPEYFFAYTHNLHFVDEHTKDMTVRALRELSRLGNTIVIPGTIPWIKPFTKASNGFSALFQSSRYNRAITRITKTKALFEPPTNGGAKNIPTSVKTIGAAKTDHSMLYYAQNTAWVMRGGEVLLKYHKRMNGSEISPADIQHIKDLGGDIVWVPGTRTGTFKTDRLSFGLEICAEHDGKALQMSAPSSLVDVHIVISATMKAQPNKAHIRDGGYLLHCDAVEPPSVHQRVGGAMTLVPPGTATGRSAIDAADIAARRQRIDAYADEKGKTDQQRTELHGPLGTLATTGLNYYTLNI